jgi:hypothetical protein
MRSEPAVQPVVAACGAGGRLACPGGLWLIGFLGALLLYVLTLAPDLVWQDSGDYQYEAARLNLSRPGDAVRVHPWLLVVAHVLGYVPLWNYAYAANLASAIGTAVAVANVLALARLMTGRTWAAAVAAVSLAVGQAVWSHAVMAETYGWAAAFLSAECLCAWAWCERGRVLALMLLFFLNGIAISNHMMASISLVVFAAWVLMECIRGRAPWWTLPVSAGCWAVGGTLYWIVLAMEYQGNGSLLETLHSATLGRWGGQVLNVADVLPLLGKSAQYVILNYPTPLLAAVFAGAAVLVRRRDALSRILVVLAAFYFVWAARYKVADQYAFFIPFYVVASLMIGAAAARVMASRSRAWAAALLAAALLPVAVYAVLPSITERAGYPSFPRRLPFRNPYVQFFQPWRTGDDGARRYAEEVLASLPPSAVLAPDSTAQPPLLCVHDLEHQRTDVQVGLKGGVEGRRVFVTSDVPGFAPAWAVKGGRLEPFGLVWEVKPAAKEGGP